MDRYSNFWRRTFAFFIDGLVLLPFEWIGDYILSSGANPFGVLFWGIFYSTLGVAYYVILHALFGQTVGKWILKIKVLDLSEERILTFRQSLMRDIAPLIMLPFYFYFYTQIAFNGQSPESLGTQPLPHFVGLVTLTWGVIEILSMLSNAKQRAIHDFIARSVIVKV
ncbi:RDD family protein [Vibrio cortegadensis]|uniref:RDD family protein n=1 Tax=Vibrio cortegadensis TaxID=1328770 RepID=A0ABV4M4T5_9VIBR